MESIDLLLFIVLSLWLCVAEYHLFVMGWHTIGTQDFPSSDINFLTVKLPNLNFFGLLHP